MWRAICRAVEGGSCGNPVLQRAGEGAVEDGRQKCVEFSAAGLLLGFESMDIGFQGARETQSTKKSGMKSFVPGATEYFSRSVMPALASTSSSMKKLPLVAFASLVRIR